MDNLSNSLSVIIPLSQLEGLVALPQKVEKLQADNTRLRNQFDALRLQYTELMIAFGELKRTCQPKG